MKKLFYITPRFPFPLEKGDKLRAYHQLKSLAEEYEVILIAISHKDISSKDYQEVKKFVKEIHILKIPNWQIILNVIVILFNGLPFQLSFYQSKKAKKTVNQLFQKHQPDIIFNQLIRTTELTKNLKTKKVLDYMDALSKGIERQMKHQPFGLRFLYQLESKRLKKYEQNIAGYFQLKYVISQQDAQLLEHINPLSVLPNGVNDRFFENKTTNQEYDICFVGNMSYPPNIVASEYLSKEIMPLLPASTQLLLAGANPVKKVKELKSDKVHVSGWMNDIRNAYSASKVFVAPLFIGTGLQNKLLEAMAMGVPCVTTSLCNNALKATHGEHLFIANTPAEFQEFIDLLLHDEQIRNQIVVNAKAFVKKRFDWNQLGKELRNDLNKL